MNWATQTIWITGASSGIGRALATAFAKRGASLILSARNVAALEQVKMACPQAAAVHIVPLDLEQYQDFEQLGPKVWGQYGPIDWLINNGGISQRALAIDTDMSVVKRLMDINYLGTVALTQSILPLMIERGSGGFVTITSLTGRFGSPYRTAYAASKHALHGYFDSLRAEVHDAGLQVTLVGPGFVHTDISKNALTGDGSALNEMDDAQANGMSPDVLAEKVIRAMSTGKSEIYPGGKERYGVLIKRWFPRVFERLIRRAKVR